MYNYKINMIVRTSLISKVRKNLFDFDPICRQQREERARKISFSGTDV
jgi:hypothetical protein